MGDGFWQGNLCHTLGHQRYAVVPKRSIWSGVNRYCGYQEDLLGSPVDKWLNYIAPMSEVLLVCKAKQGFTCLVLLRHFELLVLHSYSYCTQCVTAATLHMTHTTHTHTHFNLKEYWVPLSCADNVLL